MKDRCWSRLLLVLFLVVGLLSSLWFFAEKTSRAFTTQQVGPVRVEEAKLLMKYHGALLARYQDGRWYFLSPKGRWLPMETEAACRYLASVSPHAIDAACLF